MGLLTVAAASSAACTQNSLESNQAAKRKSVAGPVTDYDSLIESLRGAGFSVEPQGEAEQPFLSIEGRMIRVSGEDVQVFQYTNAAAAEAQAALISPDGSAVGTSRPHWVGTPHFYKKGKLLVLYVGDDDNALKALDAVLDPQFAGK